MDAITQISLLTKIKLVVANTLNFKKGPIVKSQTQNLVGGCKMSLLNHTVTGQLADKPTRGQSSRGLVNSRTRQLAKMFDL